jgi:hypothetical protein
MKKLTVFLLVALAGCNPSNVQREKASSEPQQDMQQYCSQNPCRKDVSVNFRTDGEPVSEYLEFYWPVVQGSQISILPGEEVHIEMVFTNGKVSALRNVDAIEKPYVTMTFKLQQREGAIGMNLTVKNPFNKAVKYHLNMIDFNGRAHQTSSCPAIPNGAAFESWPHPIPEIIVSDIHFLDDQNNFSCVY